MATRDLKDTILELAIEVIDEHGEQAIRTNHLAAEAGTTPPTLYHYFGSREGLIEAAQAERFFRSLIVDVDVFIGDIATVTTREQLITALQALFTRRDEPERDLIRWKRINAIGSAYARDELSERLTEMNNEIVTKTALALMPLQRQGFIRQDIDLRAVVAWYNGAVLSKAIISMEGSDIDVDQWERTMNDATLHILFGNKSVD